jgi:hypothetical protein
MKIDVIFAIASGQTDPIILPFLSKNIQCEHLVLLVSEQVKSSQSELNIEAVLKKKGVKTTIVYGEKNDFNWDGIQNVLKKTIRGLANKTIAYNSNGGTKPMVLAVFEYCYNENIPVFYINSNQLTWLYTGGNKELNSEVILSSLPYQDYLYSHGYEIINKGDILSSPEIVNLIKGWGARNQSKEIGRLNKLASRGSEKKLVLKLEDNELKDSHLQIMLDELADVNLLTFKGTDKIAFTDEKSRFFINGGWYELYLQKMLETINVNNFSGEGKVFSSIELKPIHAKNSNFQQVKNEIDVAYLLNNRLFLFECKTANLSAKEGRADEAIYKLASLLKNIGGTNATGVVFSYRKISAIDKERANLLGIKIIEHTNNEQDLISLLVSSIKKASKFL